MTEKYLIIFISFPFLKMRLKYALNKGQFLKIWRFSCLRNNIIIIEKFVPISFTNLLPNIKYELKVLMCLAAIELCHLSHQGICRSTEQCSYTHVYLPKTYIINHEIMKDLYLIM